MSNEGDTFNPLANYKQVEKFDSDLEEEYDEEETLYITLDMGQLDPNLLPNATSYKLIGLESSAPFLQIGGSTFRGDYETLLGTEIILQDPQQSGSSSSSRTLQPLATTSNRIRFREVHLVPKTSPGDSRGAGEDDNNSNIGAHIGESRSKTLGGVSREKTAIFFPIGRKEKGAGPLPPKAKRRWRKRPEGYQTSDEEKGEKAPAPGSVVGASEKEQDGKGADEDAGKNGRDTDIQMEGENGP